MLQFDTIIIGAGISGLYQLHKCRDELNLKTLVIEEGSDIGGTWYWNRYPGARCDSESHTYGYAFSKILSLSILVKSKTDLLGKLNVCPPGVFFISFFIFS